MTVERIVLNHIGIRDFLHSPPVESVMMREALQIAARAGKGYTPSTWHGRSRVVGSVHTETPEMMRYDAKTNTLLRAMRSSRRRTGA